MKKTLLALSFAMVMPLCADSIDPVKPYDGYGPAMSHKDGCPMAVEWHNANVTNLATAMDEDTLAAFVADDAAAAALLARVRGAYDTDPMIATQIAAVSQWVMSEEPCWICFWKPSPADGRKIWVTALVTRAETANDAYIQIFCLDQLRWCGCKCPCLLKRIAAIGTASSDTHVKEMVDVVLRTLK